MEHTVCSCGRRHLIPPTKIVIRPDALKDTIPLLEECGIKGSLLLVADRNTYRAAGNRLSEILKGKYPVTLHAYDELLEARIEDAENLRDKAESIKAGAILAVGTGTICDLCRYASYLTGIPFIAVATAPSMDGFCSGVAPLIENGFKRTFEAVPPAAVIGDTGVMDAAPRELIGAGVGDLLGKYTALCDWRISNILTGEEFCGEIAGMVEKAVANAVQSVDGILKGIPGATGPVLEALCLSGQAMALWGNSRPASGAEHHMAHYLEMRFIQLGHKPVYHGVKVGITTVLLAGIYRKLAGVADISPYLVQRLPLTFERIKPAYGDLTAEVLKDNSPDPLSQISARALKENWPQIRSQLLKVPHAQEIAAHLTRLDTPVALQDIGVPPKMALDMIQFGRYVRARLTMLRLCDLLNEEAIAGL